MGNTKEIIVKCKDGKVTKYGDIFKVKVVEPDIQDLIMSIHTDDLIEYIQKWISPEEIWPELIKNKS